MQVQPPNPTVEEVERIKNIDDPVIRNLQITQCYHELSAVLAARTGLAANWCTFATWASRQAGQTIRKEDLARLFERRVQSSAAAMQASQEVAAALPVPAGQVSVMAETLAINPNLLALAADRASDAVGRGNKKVFEEIGYAFARFYQTCLRDLPLEPGQIERFCAELRDGSPPEGQAYLRQAFSHYAKALSAADRKTQAEWLLLANIEIGFHEQTRLQPEIAESLDAGMLSFLEFARSISSSIFPKNSWFHLGYLYLRRLLRRPTPLDLALRALLREMQLLLREVITDVMMKISLSSGVVLRLGSDLAVDFPASLKQIANPELLGFLKSHGFPADSLRNSGALDWADLPDRLQFILALFRCYQEHPGLFDPPFQPDQVDALKNGRLPAGRL